MSTEELLSKLPKNFRGVAALSMTGAESHEIVHFQIQALKDMVYSLCQEVETLRGMLIDKEILTQQNYNKAREKLMLGDHCGRGADPWLDHSYYRYVLDEDDFLKNILELTPEQVKEFRQHASNLERLT